jgi:predicted RNA-binding protein with PUA-like domain
LFHRPEASGLGTVWPPVLLRPMRHWLMKSEPDEASIDDLEAAPGQTLPWTGVRNYQARNFMRDAMQPGDGVLFYHSSCAQPGVAGLARIAGRAEPDPTQFDPTSTYFDAKASVDQPRWLQIDVRLWRKTRLLSLREMRQAPELATMRTLQPGNRLSITPVTEAEWQAVLRRLDAAPAG